MPKMGAGGPNGSINDIKNYIEKIFWFIICIGTFFNADSKVRSDKP